MNIMGISWGSTIPIRTEPQRPNSLIVEQSTAATIANVIGAIVCGIFTAIGVFFALVALFSEFSSLELILACSIALGRGVAVGVFFLFQSACLHSASDNQKSSPEWRPSHVEEIKLDPTELEESKLTAIKNNLIAFEEEYLLFIQSIGESSPIILEDAKKGLQEALETDQLDEMSAETFMLEIAGFNQLLIDLRDEWHGVIVTILKSVAQMISLPNITESEYLVFHSKIDNIISSNLAGKTDMVFNQMTSFSNAALVWKEMNPNEAFTSIIESSFFKLGEIYTKIFNHSTKSLKDVCGISEECLKSLAS